MEITVYQRIKAYIDDNRTSHRLSILHPRLRSFSTNLWDEV